MLGNQVCRSGGLTAGSREIPPVTIPTAIAGHGACSVARQIADPLEVNALLISAGQRRCLLVSFDLLYVGGTLKRKILSDLAGRHGLADNDVFLFASHTHFAPPTDPSLPDLGPYDAAYSDRVQETVLGLVDDLVRQTPVPYRLELRRGRLPHSVNRRRPRFAPSYSRSYGISFARVSFAPYPNGHRDDTATVLTLANAETGAPVALLWHYACHPVSHTPSSVTSADFPGSVREQLRRAYAGPIPVLFIQGFCGDVRPNIEPARIQGLRQRIMSRARGLIAGTPAMQSTEQAWQTWVDSLADQVARIAASPPDLIDQSAELITAHAEVLLRKIFEGRLRLQTMAVRGLRLGRQLEILAFGAEPSAGWQQQLRGTIGLPGAIRLYAGYCGDVFGYLPLPTQVAEGGYEVDHFQKAFGMRGHFRSEPLKRYVLAAVRSVASALGSEDKLNPLT